MRKFTLVVGNVEYNVFVKRINRTLYKVLIGDKSFNVTIREDRVAIAKKVEKKEEKKTDLVEGLQIKAMLPGVVAKIIVKEGEKVKEGDVVMILEAMKMENEIKSPKDGVVKQIIVKEGDRVEVGDVLAVVD
jgi:methylmalonyl-CoA carboxyltransferase small subunit